MMPTWQHLPDPLSQSAHGHGDKSQCNDHREHTGVFLTCVPRAGLPTGCALQDALQGWSTQGVHFESSPDHGLSSPMPAGAVVTNWLSCGYQGCLLAGLCHDVLLSCVSDPKKHHGLADGASHGITPCWWHAQGKHCLCQKVQ